MLEERRNNDDYSTGPERRVWSYGKFTSRGSFSRVLQKSVESWKIFGGAAMRGRLLLYLSPRAVKSKKLQSDQNLSNGKTNRRAR